MNKKHVVFAVQPGVCVIKCFPMLDDAERFFEKSRNTGFRAFMTEIDVDQVSSLFEHWAKKKPPEESQENAAR